MGGADRQKIENYRLYGTQIDHENINHLIVAAYFQGMVDANLPAREKCEAD